LRSAAGSARRCSASRSVRAHDGWIFALVLLAGAAVVAAGAVFVVRRPVEPERRARVERAAALAAVLLAVAGLAVSIAFAGRVWQEFTNPAQIGSNVNRLGSASSSNRWTWWQEAWHAFTRHPGGGTGAGTFQLTNQMLRRAPVVVDEPHNTPLQFASETGVVGFLLYLGLVCSALYGIFRRPREPAATALAIGVAAFFAHTVVDKDWNYLAACGPVLLAAGALLARPEEEAPARRPLTAVCALAVAAAGIYSLAAPWLAQRTLAKGTVAGAEQAHAYDPLSVDALLEWAAFEDAAGHVLHAERLYRDAVSLEPENAEPWYELGAFYFEYRRWRPAYVALNNAYTYDPLGPPGTPCGLLDQARKKAFDYTPPKLTCRAAGRASSP
jgi:O-antigen ligase/polysaccharide polymerase Wzy-like membrane protein